MAALVVIDHARDLIFVDRPSAGSLNLGWEFFYFITGFGHAAVVVFFVLSGFFVGGKLIEYPKIDHLAITQYLVDRFSRIYIVLIPALLLTFAFDKSGASFSPLYSLHGYSNSLPAPVTEALTPLNFLTSLLNITMYVGMPLGSNGPLWSLAYEWVIYLVFPWLLMDWRGALSGRFGPYPALRALAICVLIFLAPPLAIWLVIWLFGVVARRYLTLPRTSTHEAVAWPILVGGAALVGGFLVARLRLWPETWIDLWLGLAMAFLCAQRRFSTWQFGRAWHEFGARFSFSLYVVHFPLILFGVALLQHAQYLPGRVAPGMAGLTGFAACVAAAYVGSWLFSGVTESNTHLFRKVLLSLMSFRRSNAREEAPGDSAIVEKGPAA